MRTKLYKAALLTVLGLSSIATAQAGTDLLLGFNDAAGPSGANNDYVIDLGVTSQFTTTAQLNYSLNSSLFSNAFSADTSDLNNVAVGVVGGNTPANGTQYLFMSGLSTPQTPSETELLNAAAYAQGTTVGEYASGASGTWSYQVAPSPTSLGLPAANGDTVAAAIGSNPLSNLAGGLANINLYEDTASGPGHGATLSGWTEIGTFAVNASADSVSFTGIDVVPEPSTCSLLGGAGLLVLLFRRKIINRKNA
jgi:hypothetical protein